MKQERIQNPSSVDRAAIETKIAAGVHVILQFDKPGYTPGLLTKINNLCGEFGGKLEVRFYGHHGNNFDASVLRHLPEVAALSVDCLYEAANLSALGKLENLRSLSLGVYNLDDQHFLKSLHLQNLETLALEQSLKVNCDLSPLQACGKLAGLYVEGHTRNIDSLVALPMLRTLTLRSIPKKHNLAFVSKIQSLRRLVVVLGGRPDISEIQHSLLEELEVIWVRGLDNLDSLKEFPALRTLVIEDQIRLGKIRFTPSNKHIQSLRLDNCKALRQLEGLEHLVDLKSIHIGMTALDVDSILQQSLASSLQAISFFTGRQKQNDEIRKKLDARGYGGH